MPPNVNIRTLEASDTAAGTPASITVEVNNRELVTPLFGEASCGGGTGHKTEVSIEVRDPGGRVVDSATQTICATGDSIGNEKTVEFSADVSEPGTHTVTASTRVVGKTRDSDTAGPVSFAVESSASDLPSSTSGGGVGGGGFDLGAAADNATDSADLGLGSSLPSGDTVLLLVGLLAVAWLADSAEGITS